MTLCVRGMDAGGGGAMTNERPSVRFEVELKVDAEVVDRIV